MNGLHLDERLIKQDPQLRWFTVIRNSEKTLSEAKIAQLGERMTEDHKVRCSIHLLGAFLCPLLLFLSKSAIIHCNLLLSPTNKCHHKDCTL